MIMLLVIILYYYNSCQNELIKFNELIICDLVLFSIFNRSTYKGINDKLNLF